MPSIDLLRTKLVAMHAARPQEVARVQAALTDANHALVVLGSLGHTYHLAEGPATDTHEDEYPRLVFHVDSAPNGRMVYDASDERELGGAKAGWFRTLEAAQYADGMDTQMAGRGGVGRKALPATVGPAPMDPGCPEAVAARAAARKAARAAAILALKSKGMQNGL